MSLRKAALESISRSPWTGVVLARDGEIAEVVRFAEELTAQSFLKFSRTVARGRRFRLVQQAQLTERDLEAILSEASTGSGEEDLPPSLRAQPLENVRSRFDWFEAPREAAEAIAKWFVGK